MSKIVVEEVKLTKKKNLRRGNYLFKIAGFSHFRNIRPGQFVHLKLPHTDLFFRRAFSVYDVDLSDGTIEILFKVFGRGTSLMADMCKDAELDILGPLGNGFKLPTKKNRVMIAAGGVGMPPLYLLSKTLIAKGYDPKKITFFYAGASKGDLVDITRVGKLGVEVAAVTEDGSYGFKGLITDAMEERIKEAPYDYKIYGCGPDGMLRAVDELARNHGLSGQLSLEAPMPCGIGVCLGCIRPLRAGGFTRICREGPVYEIGEVLI